MKRAPVIAALSAALLGLAAYFAHLSVTSKPLGASVISAPNKLTCSGDINSGCSQVTGLTGISGVVNFGAGNASPGISQSQSLAGAGAQLSITGQAAQVGSNGAGGSVVVTGGANDGAGTAGAFALFTSDFSTSMTGITDHALVSSGGPGGVRFQGAKIDFRDYATVNTQIVFALANAGANTMTVTSGDTFSILVGVNPEIQFNSTGTTLTLPQAVTASSSLSVTGTLTASAGLTENIAPVLNSPQTIACGTGGTQTVAASPTSGLIVTSGTLGSNCIIDFSTNATNGEFTLDMSGVTLGATFGVQFKNGTHSSTVITSSNVLAGDTLAKVWTHGVNTLAVQY